MVVRRRQEMDQVKIKWFEKQPGGYSENYSSGLQYALASDKNEQMKKSM